VNPVARRVLRDGLVLVAGGFAVGAVLGAGVGWIRAHAGHRAGR
jgi:NhaP-type Na+/H+ or K+/H+ antiporter